MTSTHNDRADAGDPGQPDDQARGEAAALAGGGAAAVPGQSTWRSDRKPGRHAAPGPAGKGRRDRGRSEPAAGAASGERGSPVLGAEPVARRTAAAATQTGDDPPDARRLEQTVAQLEHALTARVRVEQVFVVLDGLH